MVQAARQGRGTEAPNPMSERKNPARQHHSEPRGHTPEPPAMEQLIPVEKSLMRRLTEVLRLSGNFRFG